MTRSVMDFCFEPHCGLARARSSSPPGQHPRPSGLKNHFKEFLKKKE